MTTEAVNTDCILIHVNGADRAVPARVSIADLITILGLRRELVAVEVNRSLIRRAHHAEHLLQPGDRVEVVEFVGGG